MRISKVKISSETDFYRNFNSRQRTVYICVCVCVRIAAGFGRIMTFACAQTVPAPLAVERRKRQIVHTVTRVRLYARTYHYTCI